MAGAGATATGLKELAASIDRLPVAVTAALRAVAWRKAIQAMEIAKSLVRVDTGYTRENIHVVEEAEKKQFAVIPGTDRPRERFALHTSKRSGRTHTQKVTLNMLPNWIEYGTAKMPARPFMRPAADQIDASYKSESLAVADQVAARLLT